MRLDPLPLVIVWHRRLSKQRHHVPYVTVRAGTGGASPWLHAHEWRTIHMISEQTTGLSPWTWEWFWTKVSSTRSFPRPATAGRRER